MRIDLHTHSRASDGTQSPAEVMRAAANAEGRGMRLLAAVADMVLGILVLALPKVSLGTLAVLDSRPRETTEADLANLRDLAALAVVQLELRQESIRTTSDSLPLSAADQAS